MAVYKDNNNTWYVSFRVKDAFGKSIHKTKRGFKTKREANQFELNYKTKYSKCCKVKFKILTEDYIGYCQLRRKITTLENKSYLIAKHFLPFLGNLDVEDITIKVLCEWQNRLILHQPSYSDTYLYTVNNLLKSIFLYAEKHFDLKDNPAKLLDSIGKARNNHFNYWAQSDFQTFLMTLTNEDIIKKAQIKRHIDTYPLYVAFNLLYYSGLRLGELLALTKADLDFNQNNIRVNKTLVRLKQKNIIQTPKSKKSIRLIPMPSKIMSIIKQYLDRLDITDDEQIFYMLNKYNMWRALRSTAKLAGIKIIRLHDLRHSNASLLYSLGVPVKEISERLGHANIQTTLDIYTHISDAQRNETVQKLNDII